MEKVIGNCYGEDFKKSLDHMTKSFNRLSKRKAFKQAVKGHFRSLEITYNKNIILIILIFIFDL
ncbi:protein rep [Senegalia massiliensis]|uniref:protein rep n=1 Tax=Senegalia massiliensis TaxID=1720316 RepID=UPI001A913151